MSENFDLPYQNPVVRKAFRPVVLDDGLVLLTEGHHLVFPEERFATVAELLDGRPLSEILQTIEDAEVSTDDDDEESTADLGDVLSRTAFLETLQELHEAGAIENADAAAPGAADGEAVWWSVAGTDAAAADDRLATTTFAVDTIGSVDRELFVEILRTSGIRVDDSGTTRIVLTESYTHPGLRAYNEARLSDEGKWLPVCVTGASLWIGPAVQPWDSACWECLAQRLEINRPIETFLANRGLDRDDVKPPDASTPASVRTAMHIAAMKLADSVARGDDTVFHNTIHTSDLRSFQTKSHTVVQRPQCKACGVEIEFDGKSVAPIELRSQQKSYTQDGGHRTVPPKVTVEKFMYHVSPITGAVNELEAARVEDYDLMHVYHAGWNTAFRRNHLKDLLGGIRSSSSGKGATDIQAKASALCESLERYSAVFRGEENRRWATLGTIGEAAIHPNDVMRFSDAQYAERERWNETDSHFNWVPEPFDPKRDVEWSPVWSMTRKEVRFLPSAFLYLGYPYEEDESPYCFACTNGNAAGNTIEEAILQGFLEVVERDSVALWWYPRVRRPAIDLDSLENQYVERVRSYLRAASRSLTVLDITTDVGVPAVVAVSALDEPPHGQVLMGFGAHLDVRIAVLRAVSELIQLSGRFINQQIDAGSVPDDDESEIMRWMRNATLENQPYLVPDHAIAPRPVSAFPRIWSDDLRDDVLYCQSVVERLGLEMLVLDQTRADIRLPVIKVIVPGLRHFFARYAPGRLYDAPVQMGWLDKAVPEPDLNPIPMFL